MRRAVTVTVWQLGHEPMSGTDRLCDVGKGGAERPRRGCEVARRRCKRAGPILRVRKATARGWVRGDARTLWLDPGLLARRQRQEEVGPAGLDVWGRGEGPGPAARCTWP